MPATLSNWNLDIGFAVLLFQKEKKKTLSFLISPSDSLNKLRQIASPVDIVKSIGIQISKMLLWFKESLWYAIFFSMSVHYYFPNEFFIDCQNNESNNLFTKLSDMITLVRLHGNSKNHVRESTFFEINVTFSYIFMFGSNPF